MTDFLEFARHGRTAWWRYPVTLVAGILLALLILIGFLLVLLLLHRMPPDLAAQMQRPQNDPIFFSGIAVTFGAFAAGLAGAAALIQGKFPRDLIGNWRWSLYLNGAAFWLVVQTVLVLVDVGIAPRGFSVSASAATASLALWAFVGLAVQTFAEEFIFRGYITQGFLLLFKKPLPVAIASGVLFGALHIANGWPQAINAVLFGIVCSLIAIRTGGIALTSGIHLVNNYFGAVVVVSASDVFKGSPGLFVQDTPQLIWSDLCLAILVLLMLGWAAQRTKIFPLNSEA